MSQIDFVNELRTAWFMLDAPADGGMIRKPVSSGIHAVRYGDRFGVLLPAEAHHGLRFQRGSLRLESLRVLDIGDVLAVSSANSCHERALSWLVAEITQAALHGQRWTFDAVKAHIREWADLLKATRSGEATGLAGEILVMRYLASIYGKPAWKWWQGIHGSVRDIVFDRDDGDLGKAWEVKTTVARAGWKVTVNGLHQVSATDALSFVCVRLESVKSGGFTLADLLKDVPSEVLPANFLEDLRASGEYDSEQWKLIEAARFQVNESFPRIGPDSFASGSPPDRVLGISYTVDLGGLPCSEVDIPVPR
jgi:hypothetical protein